VTQTHSECCDRPTVNAVTDPQWMLWLEWLRPTVNAVTRVTQTHSECCDSSDLDPQWMLELKGQKLWCSAKSPADVSILWRLMPSFSFHFCCVEIWIYESIFLIYNYVKKFPLSKKTFILSKFSLLILM
jgi:hypothetical protein